MKVDDRARATADATEAARVLFVEVSKWLHARVDGRLRLWLTGEWSEAGDDVVEPVGDVLLALAKAERAARAKDTAALREAAVEIAALAVAVHDNADSICEDAS